MKIFGWYLVCIAVVSATGSCDSPEARIFPCKIPGGTPVTEQTGRVYQWTYSEPHFYYIGSPTPGENGGYIVCDDDLRIDLRVVGTMVRFSGTNKGSESDTGDPLFFYLKISSIEKM